MSSNRPASPSPLRSPLASPPAETASVGVPDGDRSACPCRGGWAGDSWQRQRSGRGGGGAQKIGGSTPCTCICTGHCDATPYAKSYVRDLWRTLRSEQQDAELREGIEPSPPMGSPPGAPPYIPPPWDAERAAAIAAGFEADVVDAERRCAAETNPVDLDRAVRLDRLPRQPVVKPHIPV
jgi:hypothetical protein